MRHRNSPRPDAGFTLAELLVVLFVLGVIAAVVGLAPRRAPPQDRSHLEQVVVDARREAIAARRPVVRQVPARPGVPPVFLLALPDGTVRTDSARVVDPLNGRRLEAGYADR